MDSSTLNSLLGANSNTGSNQNSIFNPTGSSNTSNTSGTPSTSGTSDAATSAANQVAASQSQFSSNMSSFLTLLTSQLKNQDPLSPMDSTQFTNQLVEFSQVEQQIDINSNLS